MIIFIYYSLFSADAGNSSGVSECFSKCCHILLQILLWIDVFVASLLVIVFLALGVVMSVSAPPTDNLAANMFVKFSKEFEPMGEGMKMSDLLVIIPKEYWTMAQVLFFVCMAIAILNVTFVGFAIRGVSAKKRNCMVPFMALKFLVIIFEIVMYSGIAIRIGSLFLWFIFDIAYFLLMLKVWFDIED